MSDATTKIERIAEITDKLHNGIKDLFSGDQYKAYLATMGRFHSYSFSNSMLIAMQRPDASYVAGYKTWDTSFNRHVKKGAKGIQIIQPSPFKKQMEVERTDATGKKIIGSDGKPETTIIEKQMMGYKVGYVYAYEDTEGTPLPSVIRQLDEEVPDYQTIMDLLHKISPVPIIKESMPGSANGYYHLQEKTIHIRKNLAELQEIKTTIHEISHAILHDKDTGTDQQTNRSESEVEAESVAYTVASYYGLDTSDYSFGYIADWSSGKDLKELQERMEMIRQTADQIISAMDQQLLQQQMNQSDELAYKTSEGYLFIERIQNGYSYIYTNSGYKPTNTGRIEDPNLAIVEAASQAMSNLGRNSNCMTLHNTNTVKAKIEKSITEQLLSQDTKPITITEGSVRHRNMHY